MRSMKQIFTDTFFSSAVCPILQQVDYEPPSWDPVLFMSHHSFVIIDKIATYPVPEPLNSDLATDTRRRLLQTSDEGVGEIPNPLVCLEIEEVIVFRIYLDTDDRTKSHYPVVSGGGGGGGRGGGEVMEEYPICRIC